MAEACPICDTLWRLYSRATENLRELVGKHNDARGKGDQNTVDILSHELSIAEASIGAVRSELRRHEHSRHNQGNQKQKTEEQGQTQKK